MAFCFPPLLLDYRTSLLAEECLDDSDLFLVILRAVQQD